MQARYVRQRQAAVYVAVVTDQSNHEHEITLVLFENKSFWRVEAFVNGASITIVWDDDRDIALLKAKKAARLEIESREQEAAS